MTWTPHSSQVTPRRSWWPLLAGLTVLAALLAALPAPVGQAQAGPSSAWSLLPARMAAAQVRRVRAPGVGGAAWLNTASPLRLADLRGKIVLLDFWTLCCVNCIHILPDLARLEQKYARELVVIGVHTPKFENEKEVASIRNAILRYEIKHPVVSDVGHRMWKAYGVKFWPTVCIIDPEGYVAYFNSGEGQYELMDRVIAQLIKIHRARGTLNTRPMRFELVRHSEGVSPLFFPGKVLADAESNRLFIADSTHHRLVITDLAGKKVAVAGTGNPGKSDGPFDRASFNDPQGMALVGKTLYVADRKNHLIRALDLEGQTVRTVAGTGEFASIRASEGPARKVPLSSPWDLLAMGDRLYIAMAGHHRIWTLDLKRDLIGPYAGSGIEQLTNGPLATSAFAQPSGLASNGRTLWVADSETSAIRAISLPGGPVWTLVGKGLMDFGDVDGVGARVRLQHPIGVAHHDGKLYLTDTYNNKIKVLDPMTRECKTFVGGEPEGWLANPTFSAPAGISYAGGKLYVADTNAHRIRVVDLKTRQVTTLRLQGVESPARPR